MVLSTPAKLLIPHLRTSFLRAKKCYNSKQNSDIKDSLSRIMAIDLKFPSICSVERLGNNSLHISKFRKDSSPALIDSTSTGNIHFLNIYKMVPRKSMVMP